MDNLKEKTGRTVHLALGLSHVAAEGRGPVERCGVVRLGRLNTIVESGSKTGGGHELDFGTRSSEQRVDLVAEILGGLRGRVVGELQWEHHRRRCARRRRNGGGCG